MNEVTSERFPDRGKYCGHCGPRREDACLTENRTIAAQNSDADDEYWSRIWDFLVTTAGELTLPVRERLDSILVREPDPTCHS